MFLDKKWISTLRDFGHVRRREAVYIGKRMLRMELPRPRKGGRPKKGEMFWIYVDDGEDIRGGCLDGEDRMFRW